jgi:hypothetical protein
MDKAKHSFISMLHIEVNLTAWIWHVGTLTILYITYIDNYIEQEYEE